VALPDGQPALASGFKNCLLARAPQSAPFFFGRQAFLRA
jgi:hypothetical protein